MRRRDSDRDDEPAQTQLQADIHIRVRIEGLMMSARAAIAAGCSGWSERGALADRMRPCRKKVQDNLYRALTLQDSIGQ